MPNRPRSLRRRATAWVVLAAFLLAPPGLPAAFAAPEGEEVVFGQVDPFERDGDTTTIRTHGRRTIIRYTGFDILSHETVNIHQPDPGSRILNQVRSTDPTHVNGRLWSNGQVWIVNPVGVFLGEMAVVDVGRLVAAAGDVRPLGFLLGLEGVRDLEGPVEVAEGARIASADSVLLAGRHVANYGTITAESGTIALVAGDAVRLARVGSRVVVKADPVAAPDPERFAVTQAGTVDAGRGSVHLTAADGYSLAMNHTGITRAREIHAEGGDGGIVDVGGTLDARGAGAGDTGGTIHVLGERIALRDARLDASGEAGGGDIRVGGDLQGEGELRTASRTWVSDEAVLRADAGREGDGGTVVVWADDATRFHGTLSARGGAEGGDGGFAEISGRRSLVAHGDVDLGAPHGASGTLLYDPYEIVIRGGTSDGTDFDEAADDPAEDFLLRGDPGAAGSSVEGEIEEGDVGEDEDAPVFEIYESELEGTDANIVLQARRRITTQGVFEDDDGDLVSDVVVTGGNDLTLEVTGTQEEGDPEEPGSFFGIDLTNPNPEGELVWALSDGGRLTLSTRSTTEQIAAGADPQILVDAIRTRGVREDEEGTAAVLIAGGGAGADIRLGRIDTRGTPGPPGLRKIDEELSVDDERGGNVSIETSVGDVVVEGSILTSGADAVEPVEGGPDTRGDGGAAGGLQIEALAGRIRVEGDIDASGGDGLARAAEDGEGGFVSEGSGGAGGIIVLVTGDLAGTGAGTVPSGTGFDIAVNGDLTARGGDGRGTVEVPETGSSTPFIAGATGGAGGAILVSAGAGEDTGSVGLASGVTLDASGGHGTARGGTTTNFGIRFEGGGEKSVGSITVESAESLSTEDNRFLARGGNASFQDGVTDEGAPGGTGGSGGRVTLESRAGSVTLAAVTGDAIDTGGGNGRVEAELADFRGELDGQGGSAGSVTLRSAGEDGAVDALGSIRAVGGAGEQGNGGSGGTVRFEAASGAVTVGDVDASGGEGTGSLVGEEPRGASGGAGGNIEVGGPLAPGLEGEPASIALLGELRTLGGAGVATPAPEGEEPDPDQDPNENHGLGGEVTMRAAGRLGSGDDPGSPTVRARRIVLDAGSIAPGGSGAPLVLTAVGDAGAADEEDSVEVTVAGDASFQLSPDSGKGFDRLSLAQNDPTGSVAVSGSEALDVQAGGLAGDETRHVIDELRTGDDDPHLTYRLLDGTLVVDPDEDVATPVSVGARGAKLANARLGAGREELLGDIEGAGTGPHLVARGNLELVARNVGAAGQPLAIEGDGGAEPGVELTVAGDVHLAVGGTGTAAEKIARLDVQQRTTAGDVDVALPGADEVDIVGEAVEGEGNLLESMRVERIWTQESGVAFYYSLEDDNDGARPRGEPAVVVASGALRLGAEAGLASRGDVQLEPGTADAGGHTLALFADADFDGEGAIRTSTDDAVDIVNAGRLVLLAGEGVGGEAPLQVRGEDGTGDVTVAGSGGSGDFRLVNEGDAGSELRLEPVELAFQNDGRDERASFRGIHAGGDVDLDNQGRRILLGAIQPDEEIQRRGSERGLGLQGTAQDGTLRIGFGGITVSQLQSTGNATAPHVTSGGDQTFAGKIELENARTFESQEIDEETGLPVVEKLHEVRLVAGGHVTFEGDVDTSEDASAVFEPEDEDDPREAIDEFLPASLEVDAEGVTIFRGHVGQERAFGALVTNAARFGGAGGADHLVDVERADFRGAVDGPDGLVIRAESTDEDGVPDSRVAFRGDVGAGDALAGLRVEADEILFDATATSRADRVVTREGGIALNMATPGPGEIPEVATIRDTAGGLFLDTGGSLVVGGDGGRAEKLSVVGGLAIRADGSVTLGDLSAASIRVAARDIAIRRRAEGKVRLPDGSTREDRGVDWVANDIVTNVTPRAIGAGPLPRPTFVLGDGGIDVAGPLPFDVIRFRPNGGEISAASFAGGDATLDLTGTGGRVHADPVDDIPRPAPPVAPAARPRFGDAEPAPAPPVSGAEVLAYLECRSAEGVCDAETARERLGMPSFDDSALGTERARGIAAETWALVESPDAQARLAAAFAPVEQAWRRRAGPGPVRGDALYRLVAGEPALAEARAQLDRLAAVTAQVELLGLAPADTARVQEAIARDFAEAAGMAGLDARAVLAATGTSPVGQLP